VRVVHSLFASTDDWDGQIEGTEHGWPGYFRVLRHYLQHHAGEAAASFVLMATAQEGPEGIWKTFSRGLGAESARVGQAVRVEAPGAMAMAGTIQAVDEVPQGRGVMLVVDEPAPGVVLASAMECMGMKMATLQAFYYGPRAGDAAGQRESWEQWLHGMFPPAA
jgi:hypothetical protein